MLLAAVPLVLIMVPGEEVWDSGNEISAWQESLQDLRKSTSDLTPRFPDFFFLDVDLYEHGWPIPYMARGVIREGVPPQYGFLTDSYKGIGWIYAETWPFFADKRIFRGWALAVDLAVGLLFLGIVGAVIEWRIRSGDGRWRFRLFDAFLITAVLALFLAPFAYHAHVQRLEAPVLLLSLEENGIERDFAYHGPVWLRKLAGNKFFLRSMFHIDAVTIDPSDNWQEEFAQLEKCPYLNEVTINHWLPLGAIPILERNQNLKHLGLPDLGIADMLRKEQGDPHEPFHAEHIVRLKSLKVTSISVNGLGYQARHIRQIAELPTIQTIWLSNTLVSGDELTSLRRDYPHVTFIIKSNYGPGKPILWTDPRIDVPVKLPTSQ
ncbi:MULTISPECIES: hypothetical protein [Pirellulaceae]|nr:MULTISPECIES: hypothetical protein [Pirellulaceae]